MAINEFGVLAPHPFDKRLHRGMRADGLRCGIVCREIASAEYGMELAVTNQMDGPGLSATLRLGHPVVPVHTRPFNHLSSANGARAEAPIRTVHSRISSVRR